MSVPDRLLSDDLRLAAGILRLGDASHGEQQALHAMLLRLADGLRRKEITLALIYADAEDADLAQAEAAGAA